MNYPISMWLLLGELGTQNNPDFDVWRWNRFSFSLFYICFVVWWCVFHCGHEDRAHVLSLFGRVLISCFVPRPFPRPQTGDRFGIVSDIFALSQSGLQETTLALDVCQNILEFEITHPVWVAALDGFGYISNRLYEAPYYSAFQVCVLCVKEAYPFMRICCCH